jgi:GR25 family glycosyltransferase involved in LPS biosynthesis
MRIHLINLDRSTERLAEFTARNGHLAEVTRFPAIDGRHADRRTLTVQGIIGPGLDYTDGALGNCLSHFALWDLAIAGNGPITLCEDDAIFNRGFERDAEALMSTLPPDWHMIFWGWNFDAFALFELLPGVSPLLAQFDQDQMRAGIEQFQAASVMPRAFRLLAAFGIAAYSISPGGARVLRQLLRPVRAMPVTVPAVGRRFANKDLSIALLDALPRISAFASLPPLVITRNDRAISTVLAPISPGGRNSPIVTT